MMPQMQLLALMDGFENVPLWSLPGGKVKWRGHR